MPRERANALASYLAQQREAVQQPRSLSYSKLSTHGPLERFLEASNSQYYKRRRAQTAVSHDLAHIEHRRVGVICEQCQLGQYTPLAVGTTLTNFSCSLTAWNRYCCRILSYARCNKIVIIATIIQG